MGTARGQELILKLCLFTSFVCLSFIMNPGSLVIRLTVIAAGLIFSFVKPLLPARKEITPDMIICTAMALILLSFCGSIGMGYTHLALSLLISVPASFCLLGIGCSAASFFGRYAGGKKDFSTADLNRISRVSLPELITILITSVVTITLVSTSSPLYNYNYWDDANVFLTMGKGILHGLVPYRDLYEQKGPVLFFIHALCAAVPGKPFLGVWILETAEAFIFLLFSWKIVKLYTSGGGSKTFRGACFLIPLISSVVYTTNMFHLGDSAEEMAFPLLTVIMFIALKALRTSEGIPSGREMITVGILTAVLFWVKYTLAGFVAGFVLFYLIYTIARKDMKSLGRSVLMFLAGFAAVTLPVLIYFIVNGATGDLFEAYFYNNIFLYNRAGEGDPNAPSTLLLKIISIPAGAAVIFKNNYILFLVIISSLIMFPLTGKRGARLLIISFITTLVFSFSSDYVISYYALILAVFAPVILIPLAAGTDHLVSKLKDRSRLVLPMACVILTVVSCAILMTDKNLYLLSKSEDELPQKIFSEEIKKTEDPKILTYDVMDLGFYEYAGVLPSNRFFCFLNIRDSLPDLLSEQHKLIADKYFDYIITYSDGYEWEGYEIAMSAEYSFPYSDGLIYTDHLYLYRKVG